MSEAPSGSTKDKGDLLESVVLDLCSGLSDVKVTRNASVPGRQSRCLRDVDVLIEGKLHVFDVKIAIEAKHYDRPVGVEKIESLRSKLEDIGADVGVMVCPTGFTEPARNVAASCDIQLYEIHDARLGNCDLLLPVRLLMPQVERFKVGLHHRAPTGFRIGSDHEGWRIHDGGKRLTVFDLLKHVWSLGRVPQTPDVHRVELGAATISDESHPDEVQYCELNLTVEVSERYYLKLFPASFLTRVSDGRQQHDLCLDVYSTHEDMIKNGWREYASLEEMEAAARIPNHVEIPGLLLRAETFISENS